MLLEFILYTSRTKTVLPPDTVHGILEQSRSNNKLHGLTGFLHYHDKCFVQYLEGPPAPLASRVRRIAADRRHRQFRMIAHGDLGARMFPHWEMGEVDALTEKFPRKLQSRHWLKNPPEDEVIALIEAFASVAGQDDKVFVA